MRRLKHLLRRRRPDERGATLILTAICSVLLLWAGATGVDVGFTVYGSRQAQAMADTAALDLARYISYADTLSSIQQVQTYLNGKLANVVSDNGSSASMTVTPGYDDGTTFTADGYEGEGCRPTVAPPVHPGCNAIEVTADQSVPQIFFGGFNVLPGHSGNTVSGTVSGSSVASDTPEAGFSIGSYLASLNTQQSGVLNDILSPLGTSVNLTAVGYEGLANTYVTLDNLITASGGLLSDNNIMSQSLTAAQWLSIFHTAVGTEEASVNCGSSPTPDVCSAYTALGSLSFGASKVSLCQLVNINIGSTQYNCSNTGISTQGLSSSVDVYQLLNTEAMLANGSSAIDITSALNLSDPGLLSIGTVKLSVQVIQPAQVAYGPVGTTATTAQVSASLSVNLATLLGINLGTLTIPLSAATGTATLASVTCVDNAMTSTSINAVTNTMTTGSNGITLNLLGVISYEGSLTITGGSKSMPFTGANVPPTASTATASPPTNPQNVYTTAPTLSFSANGGINGLIAGLLTPTSVLAEAYGPVLQALGVEVAGAQVADLSTNCGAVSLVQ